jgi:hypothetical protein
MQLQKVKNLHALAMEATQILKKGDSEPRTNIRITPSGEIFVTLYSSCFSFIASDFNHITFPIKELDDYIDKAKEELSILRSIEKTAKNTPRSLKSKPNTIPYVICIGNIRRIYWFHLCKYHRNHIEDKSGHCNCYVTWEELGE